MNPKYEKGAPLPTSIGLCADMLAECRDLRLEMQRQTDGVKERESEIKNYIIENLPKSQISGAAGNKYRVQLVKKDVPTLKDWEKFTEYVRIMGRWDLLHKRVADGAVKAIWEEGESVPGVEKYTSVEISLTKI